MPTKPTKSRRRPVRLIISGGVVPPGTLPANNRHPLAGRDAATRERRFLHVLGGLLERAVDEGRPACDHVVHDEPT